MASKSRVAVSALFCSTLIIGAYDVRPAYAGDGGAAVAAGIAGFALGVITGNAASRARPPSSSRNRTSSNRSRGSSSSRPRSTQAARSSADVVAVQKALAHFGYYSGTIDGISGRQTRSAISDLQTQQSWPVTGQLTDDQKKILLTTYADAQSGKSTPTDNSNVDQLFAMINNQAPGAGGASAGPVAPIPAAGVAVVPAAGIVGPTVQTASVAPADTPQVGSPQIGSYRAHCPDDAPAAAAPQAGATLSLASSKLVPDQFCAARSAALIRSADTFAQLTGVDLGQIQAECARIATTMKPHRDALAAQTPAAAIQSISAEFKSVAEDQKAGAVSNFMVCLGVGYANDQTDVVVSASLGLMGLGEVSYGELIGGSFALGAGLPENSEKAIAWLDYSAEQIEAGAPPIARDAGVERATILRLISAELAVSGGGKIILASNTAADVPAPIADIGGDTAVPAADEPPADPVVVAEPPAETPAEPVVVATNDVPATQTVTEAGSGTAVAPPVTDPTVEVANVVTEAPAASGPATTREQRKQEATAFFEGEMADQAKQLDDLVAMLGLGKDSVAATCGDELAALSENGAPMESTAAGGGMMLRVCRSWAYAGANRPAMYWFDRALSDAGDADAESRLTKHLLLGHDRQTAAAQ